MEFTERRISENFWCFEQNGVRSFLLIGREQSLLIDACYGGDLRGLCETKTNTPIRLVLTHADRDHVGCIDQFDSVSLHPAEFAALQDGREETPRLIPLWEQEMLDIGSFRFEVVLLPGHTPGSIALLETEKRFLISGDSVQTNPIHMFGAKRSVPAFRASMERLCARKNEFDDCFASHGELRLGTAVIDDLFQMADSICRGEAPPALPLPENVPASVPAHIRRYQLGSASFLL